MRILIVEDDASLAAALARILEDNGYAVDVVHDGNAGVAWGESGLYDVIILDVMLPGQDGFSVTRALRRSSVSTPVLLLTARDATADKIAGLDAGADDYMTKPFSPAELMAHLRALTRRQGDVVFERLAAGDLSLDLEAMDLGCGGTRLFMGNVGQVLSKDTIIERAWDVGSNAGDNNVEAYVSFLRKKLRHLGSTAQIETIRGAGYRLAEHAEDARS